MQTKAQPQNCISATGIVAEYNPLHNGHAYHVREAKRLTNQPVIAVMSGSMMQRGEPAFADKWLRAELAVQGGVDLVLELPACFSLRSAQYFASGAVQLLAATGIVTHLCCGVETPATDFAAIAASMSTDAVQSSLRALLRAGHSYASACAQVMPEAGFSTPNDILALEYAKAILRHNAHVQATGAALPSIEPLFIHRRANNYNDNNISGTLASATAIRTAYRAESDTWQQAVPPATRNALQNYAAGYDEQLLWQLIAYSLRLATPRQIAACTECSEGLENLLKQAQNCASLDEALASCTNKRYSTSRIRRLLLQLLLDTPRAQLQQSAPAYLRVLACNATGRTLLKQMKKTAALPILTKLGRYPAQGQSAAFAEQIALDIKTTDLWALLALEKSKKNAGQDFTSSPAII